MKVCPVCGTEYGDEAAFCSRDRSSLRPSTTESQPGLVGQLIGERYQVERRLGEGGMGEVYLARHVLMGRHCALKVMSQALSRDPDAVSRFNREATNASRITHPNVCAVYDFGLTPDGLVYLAMEYVEGRALSELLDEVGPLPVARAASLVSQCAHGLQVAHDLGIVHRDLKPDNIMVTAARDREIAKLVDFGIAKAVETEPGQRVTKTGFVVGTPEYMAPEQLAGDPVDGRSDQYALALVFYRSITGLLPFEAASVQETLVKRLTDPPRPLALARPDVRFPAGLQGIMDRALARDPVTRYASVTAFSSAISEVVAGDAVPTRRLEPVRAEPIPIPATPVSRPEPQRAGTRFLVAAGAVLAVGAGAWAVLDSKSGTPLSTPLPEAAPVSPAAGDTTPIDSAARGVTPPPPSPLAAEPGRSVTPPVASATLSAGDSLELPEVEHFDTATRRPWAVRQSQRVLDSESAPRWKRAMAAALLADARLQDHDKPAALRFYQRARALYPENPTYLKMIRQLQDSVPE